MRLPRGLMISCLTLALLGGLPALADGLIIVQPSRPHIGPLPPGQHAFTPLEIRSHHVEVSVNGQLATTSVDQVFFNPSGQRLEGEYLFPIPKGARIDNFSMDIGGTPVQAELLDADKARKIYEDIVRRMKDPALLEYAGEGLFRVRIYPIEPRSDKRVRLKYTQLLRRENGITDYLYPLNTEKFSAKPLKNVSIRVELSSKRALSTIYSPSHEVEVTRNGAKAAVVAWEASQVRPEEDFQLYFSTAGSDALSMDLLTYPDPDESGAGYFLLLASPSRRLKDAQIVRKDVVFVLDSSGSMASENKLDQARRALEFCLENLNTGDRFEVIRFSTEAEPLFGGLKELNGKTRTRAREFVQSLKPRGGTAIDDALRQALESSRGQSDSRRPLSVVFLTDGQPTIGVIDKDQILQRVVKLRGERSVRIFCFGLGTDVNTHLLDMIAAKTRATSEYVLPKEDIEIKVSNFYSKINDPVLANPHLKVTGPVRVDALHPRDLPDLFRGEQLVLLGRYKGRGDAALTLSGTVNGKPKKITYEGRFGKKDGDTAFIARLWATRRVGYLLEQIRLSGENAELREEVTRLARRYGIVTPYTAYLIVEDEARRSVPVASRTLQLVDRNREVREEAERIYRESNAATSGDAAVGGSKAQAKLKSASGAYANAQANRDAWEGQTLAPAPKLARTQSTLAAQKVVHRAGRSFYQNGDQWIDAAIASKPGARRVQIAIASPEYFRLMRSHPLAPAWLSVGRDLQLLIGGTVYEIR